MAAYLTDLETVVYVRVALRDAYEPPPCMLALLGAVHNTHQHSSSPSPYLKEQRTFLLAWITAPRTPHEMEALLSASCACPADMEGSQAVVARAHRGGAWALNQPIGENHDRVCPVVLAALLRIIFDEFQYGARQTHDRCDRIEQRQQWPRSTADLLPHGAEDTVRGLMRWFKADIGKALPVILIQAADTILQFTHPLTSPYMITSDALLGNGLVPIMHMICDLFEERADVSFTIRLRNELFSKSLIFSSRFISFILVTTCDEAQRRRMTATHASALQCAYDRVIDTYVLNQLEKTRGPPYFDSYEPEVRIFLEQLSILVHDFPDLPRSLHAQPVDASGFWRLMEQIQVLARARRCASPACTNTSVGAARFRYCGGCRRVIYCSRRCQKAAWVHPAAPHRAICAVLRRVCLDAQIPRKLGPERHGVARERVNEELGHHVADHFAAQTRHEIETSRLYRSEAEWEAEVEARAASRQS